MTAREWYVARASEWARRRDATANRGVTVSRLRLVTFFGALALVWWGVRAGSFAGVTAGTLMGAAFATLVVVHARLLAGVEYAEAARSIARRGLARLDREWNELAENSAAAELNLDTHPYARDLDLFGHASLSKWLGPAATSTGESILLGWLLAPAAPDDIVRRQHAITELANQPEWREALATEGQIERATAPDLLRFTDWSREAGPAVPRPVFWAVILVTAAIWLLIILQATHVLADAWWALPMLIGIVLSFAFARPVYAVFNRASPGERALQRYVAMLELACSQRWSAPELARLQAELRVGGDAPRIVKRLSRLVAWSELRTAAALLHFPIQALTLWDFHVLFALERWRRRYGGRIDAWVLALGGIDALSVLSAIRHENPGWAFPTVDRRADRVSARRLGHPLILDARRVANDVEVGPPGSLLLVSGSNMSGKSTLLRAIGLNAVLAEAGAPVCASALTMPPCDLHTSIRVQDSLELGLSYFMAALSRLKVIVDAAGRARAADRILLYLLDEVLQGTNSAERAIAVRAVARHLLDARTIGAMTTHDLTIAEEEPFRSQARFVHFAEQVHDDGSMSFDYCLRPGLATSRNALRLMQLIGIAPR